MDISGCGWRLLVALTLTIVVACTATAEPAPLAATSATPPSTSDLVSATAEPPAFSASPDPSPRVRPTAAGGPPLEPAPTATPALPAAPAPTDLPPPTVRLMAVGDVMLAQSIGRRIVRKGPLAPWKKVVPYFDRADLVVANLECTISNRGTAWPKTFTFRAPIKAADSLVAAGIDVVSLANNHALDYGIPAFEDTM
ncbi:MAG TPA: CapA family protein, partial [Candidatus Limnocylindrales bacterium]|nr:CapA family protein [Candidatus Limnocylindrales bacterium]